MKKIIFVLLLFFTTSCWMTKTRLTEEDMEWLEAVNVGDVICFASESYTDTLIVSKIKFRNPKNMNPFDNEGQNRIASGTEILGEASFTGYIFNAKRYACPLYVVFHLRRNPHDTDPNICIIFNELRLCTDDLKKERRLKIINSITEEVIKYDDSPINIRRSPYQLSALSWTKTTGYYPTS